MMREEFVLRTGFCPTFNHYEVIEEFYMDSKLDKDAFCKAFLENTDGLAEKIYQRVAEKEHEKEQLAKQTQKQMEAEIQQKCKEIAHLNEELDRELEWKPYVDEHLMSDKDYQALEKTLEKHGFTEYLTDEAAVDYIKQEFGFDPCFIEILRLMPLYQINRHRALKRVGDVVRAPLYAASDWNYILFSCKGIVYEMVNGHLTPYVF